MSNTLHKTEDWHEDMGDCLFFHFYNLDEPPRVLCSNPLSSDFQEQGEEYWAYFVTMNFNFIFEQAEAFMSASIGE